MNTDIKLLGRGGRSEIFALAIVVLLVLSTVAVPVGAALGSTEPAHTANGAATPVDASGTSHVYPTFGDDGLSGTISSTAVGPSLDAGDWGTAGRDPGRSGHNPSASGPTTDPDARWTYEFTDDDNDIPAVVAAGHVYVPGEDSLRAIDNDTGEEVWNVSEPSLGSVTAAQDVVVTTATSYTDGDWIRGYHATNGTEAWNVSNFEADTSVAFDGTFYVTRGEYLYAYDLQTGEQLWSADVNEDVTGSLSAADGTIYATGQVNGRDYAVYARNASDGTEEWRFEMEGELSMRPTAVDDSVFVGAGDETYDPKFYKLNATDGHVEWIFDVNAQPRGAAVADGYVYLAAGNTVHALDETRGQREWRHRFAGSIEYGLHYHGMHARSPAVADGTVYAVNDRGFLVALDGATGTELWEYRLEGWAMGPAVADDRLYVHVTDTEDTNTDYSRVYALEEPPFQFSDFALSSTAIEPGESLTATLNVTNVDDETRAYDLSLMADPPLHADWRAIDRANGTLAPGESRELTFVGTVYSSGSWTVSVKRPLESDPAVDPVTVAVETPGQSDDWPSVGFDSGRTGDNPDTVGPMRNAQEVWNLTYFDDDARPVIANGSVFVVQEQTVYSPHRVIYTLAAYDEATSALEWEFNVSARDRAAAGSATVDGDTVYLFTRPMNFDGEGPAVHDNSLFALNRSDGALEWSSDFTLNKTLGTVDQAPVVADGQVYVAGGIPEDSYGDSNASLIAFDADSGAKAWDYTVAGDRENELFYYVTAADGMVVATLADEDYDSSTGSTYDDRLVVMNAGGGIEWSTSGLQIDVQEPPVIRNGTVYAISETQQGDGDPIEVLHAFDLADGSTQWSFSPTYREDEASGWTLDSPIVTDDGVYVHQRIDLVYDASQLYRLDPTTGDIDWNRSVPNLRTTFAVGGLLYAGDAAGDYTFVYNAETGEKYTETDFFSRGRGTAQAIANGTMITYADTTTPNEFRVIREGGIIEYTDLSVDTHTIGEGENVTVTVTATNHGAYARNYDVNLDVAPDNHGDRHFWNYATREGTLAPGESTTITWTVRLDVRDDFVFFLVPLNDGDGNEDDDVGAMNMHKYDRAGTETVHVGDADDGTVFDLGDPRDLAPDAASWPKESFDAGNTGNYTGTGAPTAVGDDTVSWAVNHSSEWTSGPMLAEDTVFAGGYDGGDEAIYAFNATDGSLRWEYPTERDVEVAPTYAGGYLYTADGSGRVYQFDATTSERLWTYQGMGDVGGITVVDDVAYVSGDVYADGEYSGTVHALNATTREVLWTFTRASSSYGMDVTPAVENGTVYVTSDDGYTYALNATTGAIEWSEQIAGTGSTLHSPVVEDGVVYVDDTAWDSTDAHLYALDATDGSTIWSIPANVDGSTGSSPALADDTLFFTADSAVRAVDATNGDELWSTTICSAAEYSPVHAGGVVYVGTTDSAIRAYDADTGDLVWRYDAYYEYAFTPAVVDGMLYTTGLENTDDVYSLMAMEGGPTDELKTLFEYDGLSVSNEAVAVGEPVTVSATVQNQGDAACDYAADLVIDGTVEDTATGSLGDGSDETVEFTHSFASVGTYNVTVEDLPPVEVTVTASSPGISATPSTVEYGEVDVGDTHGTIDVLIENDGTAPLEVSSRSITGPDSSDFGFSYRGPNSPIAPGGSSWVGVWFAPSHEGAHTAAIELENNATQDPFEIPLTGTGVVDVDPPAVQVTPSAVDFGDVTSGSSTEANVTVENVGGSALSFDGVTVSSSDFGSFDVVAGDTQLSLDPGESHDVTVEFAPTSANPDTTTLTVNTDDPSTPAVDVTLSGTGVPEPEPDISVTPTAHFYESVPVDDTRTTTVAVTNTGDATLDVTEFTAGGPNATDFTVQSSPFTVAPGGTETFDIEFAPTTLGAKSATVDVASNDTDESTVTIELGGGVVDTTAPVVDSIDVVGSNESGSTVYANETVAVEVNATDDHSEIDRVFVGLNATNAAFVAWESATFDQLSGTWTATFDSSAVPDDGVFTVEAVAIDVADNGDQTTAPQTVVVDRTNPVLGTSLSRLDETTAEVTLTASEPLRSGSVDVNVALPDGTETSVPMTGSGEDWTGSFSIGEDGQYEIDATGVDHAGNSGTDNATSTFQAIQTTNETVTVVLEPSGTFVQFNTSDDVENTFVVLTDSRAPLAPLGNDRAGLNFLRAQLGAALADNLTDATIGVPVDESKLPRDAGTGDVRLSHFNETTKQWEDLSTEVRTVTIDGSASDYWVTDVDHFSTYGAVVTDTSAPTLDGVSPTETLAAGTTQTDVRFEYSDDISGVDASTVTFTFDGDSVSGPPLSVTSGYVSYTATDLSAGTYTATTTVTDRAGNDDTFTHTFTIESASSGGSGGGSGGSGGGSVPVGGNAEITVTDLTASPTEIETGETVTITAMLENTGEKSGDHTVELRLDGDTIAEESVTVASGETETVTVTHTFDDPGTYTISVDGTELTLEVGDAVTAPNDSSDDSDDPDGTDDDQDGHDDGDGSDPDSDERDDSETELDESDDTNDDNPDPADDDGQPGFGFASALVALLTAGLFAHRFDLGGGNRPRR
ncbi:PQQ-binding-like beta-propeller repeat protein [Halomontanus rarus]|uniref:outer membrane protein assembly factor BamB family protein n=1 Tax=Halomontanus rarus TaxID=3034020 RepID=UPI001A99E75D